MMHTDPTPATPTDARPCDYCGEHPVATDYGACAECAEGHEANRGCGPRLWVTRNGVARELRPGSAEYDFYLDQLPR